MLPFFTFGILHSVLHSCTIYGIPCHSSPKIQLLHYFKEVSTGLT
jgi:hypothetical protein